MRNKRDRIHQTNRTPKSRPRFFPISEEMKQWSAMLISELNTWPEIRRKSMFGFLSFYRSDAIFAALPRSRGLDSPSSLIVKFSPMPPALLKRAQADPRINTSRRVPGKGWFSFRMGIEADIRDVLWWLCQAYKAAKTAAKRQRRQ